MSASTVSEPGPVPVPTESTTPSSADVAGPGSEKSRPRRVVAPRLKFLKIAVRLEYGPSIGAVSCDDTAPSEVTCHCHSSRCGRWPYEHREPTWRNGHLRNPSSLVRPAPRRTPSMCCHLGSVGGLDLTFERLARSATRKRLICDPDVGRHFVGGEFGRSVIRAVRRPSPSCPTSDGQPHRPLHRASDGA